jgi:hypothetical protein
VPASAVAFATLVSEAFASHRVDFSFSGDLPSVIAPRFVNTGLKQLGVGDYW